MSLTVKNSPDGYQLFYDGLMVGTIAVERDEERDHGGRRIAFMCRGIVADQGGTLSPGVLDTSFSGSSPEYYTLSEMDQRTAVDYGWIS